MRWDKKICPTLGMHISWNQKKRFMKFRTMIKCPESEYGENDFFRPGSKNDTRKGPRSKLFR
jgi:hypothetical protein